MVKTVRQFADKSVPPALDTEVTADDFLGGRLRLRQPARGYRISLDSVLLAASVPAQAGQRVLDVGAGTGAVALCLARRVEGLSVDGVEQEPDHLALARQNAQTNGLADRVRFAPGDIFARPAPLAGELYDHVVTNPPFFEAGKSLVSPHAGRDAANRERAGVTPWLAYCLKRTRLRGLISLVFPASRLDHLLAALAGGSAGSIEIFPLWPRTGQPAKRVLVRAVKGGKAGLVLHPGLVLHHGPGQYSPAAEAVLRHGAALEFTS